MTSLQGFKEAGELSLLSKQRMTNGPQNVFDASQFKLAVEQDVSLNIVERLQKEFGTDMAGGKTFAERSKILSFTLIQEKQQLLTNSLM